MSTKKHDRPEHTTAIELQHEDGTHVVGIGNLRVVLVDLGGCWIARGLEINYFAQGDSLEDVKKSFEDGLNATLDENIKAFGTIEKVLQVAPADSWNWVLEKAPELQTLTHISFHQCSEEAPIHELAPWFSGIEYYSQAVA